MRRLAILVTLALTLPFSSAAGAQTQTYDINVILSLSGPAAFMGSALQKTLSIVETMVNRTGGIRGRNLRFVINDDQSNPQTTVQFVGRLQSEGVPLILGPGFTQTCAAAMALTANNGPVTWCTSGLSAQS